jgi:hypothetical protein
VRRRRRRREEGGGGGGLLYYWAAAAVPTPVGEGQAGDDACRGGGVGWELRVL